VTDASGRGQHFLAQRAERRVTIRGGVARAVVVVVLGVASMGFAGCDGGSEPPGSALPTNGGVTVTMAAEATGSATGTTALDSTRPDATQAMAHIEYLSVTIGARPAGSEAEREAAAYIADVLRDAGYVAELEEFEFEALVDQSAVRFTDGGGFQAFAMQGSPKKEATGPAVFGGLGREEDLAGVMMNGSVVVMDRGVMTFREKVAAAAQRGAVAVIVINEGDGPFRGSLGQWQPSIPVVAVAGRHRERLHELLGSQLTVRASLGMESHTSQNVVASRSGGDCDVYLGAHYDSVELSPGANDNASGTAVLLEVARTTDLDGLCVIAFGAEEVGLFGSRHHVAANEVGATRFMLNVDMAGRADGPIIVGDAGLTNDILSALETAGVGRSLRAGSFPPFAASDHVSFEAVGIPAVTFNSGDDEAIHSPSDTIERIDLQALAMFLESVHVAVRALVGEQIPAGAR